MVCRWPLIALVTCLAASPLWRPQQRRRQGRKPVTPTCSAGSAPADNCTAWYRSSVRLGWQWSPADTTVGSTSGCDVQTLSSTARRPGRRKPVRSLELRYTVATTGADPHRHDASHGDRRHAGPRTRPGWLVQPSGPVRLQRQRRHVGSAGLFVGHVRRAGQRHGDGTGDLHRCRRQRRQPRRPTALRRDAAVRRGHHAEPTAGPRRLVHRTRRFRFPRERRLVGRGWLLHRVLPRSRRGGRERDRYLQGPRRQRRQPVLRDQLRRHVACPRCRRRHRRQPLRHAELE